LTPDFGLLELPVRSHGFRAFFFVVTVGDFVNFSVRINTWLLKTYSKTIIWGALALALGMMIAPVNADPTPTGNVVYDGQLLSGTNFNPGMNENTSVQVYLENTDLTLSSALFVDRIGPDFGSVLSGTSGKIAAGTQVTDYIFHYDYPGKGGGNQTSGTITFDEPILGLIIFTKSLDKSDSAFGLSGVTYYTGKDRGLEKLVNSPNGIDNFSVSGDALTYNIADWTTTTLVDEIRVIVAVPEPSTALLVLLGAGVWCILWTLRRRTKKAHC